MTLLSSASPERRIEWYAHAMEHLIVVIQELSQAHSIDTVTAIVRTAARQLTGADGATFVFRDDDKCYYADEDAISPLWKGQRFPMSACISGWTMLNKQHTAIEDIYKDDRIPADAYRPTFVKSLVMVPIRKQNPIGAIGNYWAETRKPLEEEIKILQALADATSVTLRNLELYDELQKSYQQREKSILDNMLDGAITTNADGIIENYNKASERIFGYTAQEAIGKSIEALMPERFTGTTGQYQISAYLGIGEDDSLLMRELEGRRKDGSAFPIEASVAKIDIDGQVAYTGIVRDITERKEIETTLQQAKTQAEKATQAKSDFLANMSHELRTPLNSIIGMTRLLYEDKTLGREHKDMVGISYKSATRLLDIVNDILDLSKVEAGELLLENTPFSLEDTVSGTIQTMLPLSSQKRLTFEYDMSGLAGAPLYMGDPLRLGRVMINLAGNAIKYTEEGSVSLDTRLSKNADGSAVFDFAIRDTGIGIAEEKIPHVFDKFAQADSTITRRFGGTGLGLHIAKQLVEKMGGEIGVESRESEGSRFWFRIPLAKAADEPADALKNKLRAGRKNSLPAEARRPAADVRVLIGEDHLLNQQYMRYLMRRMGFRHFDMVGNGRKVVDKLKKRKYDLILMDCHMPEMSGYAATKIIRDAEKLRGGHIPIVAMTADAMIGTRERCLAAGMDDYISKPLDTDELQHILEDWFSFSLENTDTQAATPQGSAEAAEENAPSLAAFATKRGELAKLVAIFTQQSEAVLDILQNSCIDGPCDTWREAAHKLKGSAAVCNAHRLRDLCDQAQHMDDTTTPERREILQQIKDEYARTKDILTRNL
ncbi:MAG: ATP-binding protein [Bdellovibrionales bacterium]|jgi:PAS domain S-box-containing protein|nr:ATP-binding protein [Bdellovibrionales bacterium]